MRIVIEPSVLVSSLIGGWARELGWRIDEGVFDLYVSQALVEELREVVSRPRFCQLIRAGEAEWLVGLLLQRSTVIEPTRIEEICRDSDDDYLLALADASQADYLVTRDEDLLSLHRYHNTEIIYPARLMQLATRREDVS